MSSRTYTTTKARPAPGTTDATGQSPPKKPRLQAPPQPQASGSKPPEKRTLHTHAQLWKWTLTSDAVAPCRVEDIFDMQECDGTKAGMDPDFFWLGRVPCRSVMVYGIVVGVQQYEQRTVYSLDDGSGAIDCNLRHVAPPVFARSPKKPRAQTTASKYAPKATAKASSAAATRPNAAPHDTQPTVFVGDIVRVTGRVLNRHTTRLLNLDKIVVCKNPTDEPLHWMAVAGLHKTWYHPADPELFIIPEPKARIQADSTNADPTASVAQGSPFKVPPVPASPAKSVADSSAPSTPSSVGTASDTGPQSPPRLRHPSRLHTRDLTANTFRIYLKHYMDNAPPDTSPNDRPSSPLHEASDDEDDDLEKLRSWLQQEPETPTKRKPRAPDATPRPHGLAHPDATPRAASTQAAGAPDDPALRGFTLSHLRRVPELALLARRVVDAEAKRRAREERKREKEQAAQAPPGKSRAHKSSAPASRPAMSAAAYKHGEPRAAKMKRLFRYAVRQLYDEGSIVLWDGPVRRVPLRPLPAPSFVSSRVAPRAGETSRLWRASGSSVTASHVSSVSQAGDEEDEDGELSDPPEDEDAYIPLTPAYLCRVVEDAIRTMANRPPPRTAQGWKTAGPPPGPTPDEIVSHLHRRDERWARVGNWAVKDALDWGKDNGRVWCIGDNRWEICG